MSTLVPFKLGQSVTYRDVFYIIFSGRKCDHTVCYNSLVRGVATADGNRVAGRLYCHVRAAIKFSALINKILLKSKFRRLQICSIFPDDFSFLLRLCSFFCFCLSPVVCLYLFSLRLCSLRCFGSGPFVRHYSFPLGLCSFRRSLSA